jgi:hypothetical protein
MALLPVPVEYWKRDRPTKRVVVLLRCLRRLVVELARIRAGPKKAANRSVSQCAGKRLAELLRGAQ